MKPMLAATPDDLDQLRYPLLASPKLDGIRAIVLDGVVYSRKLKPIPSTWVQKTYGHLNHYDGELIAGDPTSSSCFRDTTSAVMAQDGEGAQFYAFDHLQNPADPYEKRLLLLDDTYYLPQKLLLNRDELLAYESQITAQGYEGVIVRSPNAPYKYGRSTMREQYLVKIKRFVDNEFVVIGFEEQMHNANPAERDAIGRLKRSHHQANMVPKGTLGSLLLEYTPTGQTMSVGSGFTDEERDQIWSSRDSYLGRLAKVKWFPVGVKDLPRHPVFLGWRTD